MALGTVAGDQLDAVPQVPLESTFHVWARAGPALPTTTTTTRTPVATRPDPAAGLVFAADGRPDATPACDALPHMWTCYSAPSVQPNDLDQ